MFRLLKKKEKVELGGDRFTEIELVTFITTANNKWVVAIVMKF